MDEKKVLLVEDDPFLSSLLKNRLLKENIQVTHATNGQEALDILKNYKPDLILLDLILPKKSGFEVMEGIRQDPQLQNAPIIIISNLGQPEDIQKGQELGALEYFIKAKTSIDDLVSNIKGFLMSESGN
jgi:DNA-binding response OmpR family regulator